MSEPVRVLLVEDNAMDVEIVTRILYRNPYLECSVDVARSGEEALEKIKNSTFDVILCDFNMPGMNGLETLRKLGKSHLTTPVIMVTGQRDQKMAALLIREGAYDYVSKEEGYSVALPFVIGETLSQYRAKQDKERLEREILEKNAKLQRANEDLNHLNQLKSNFVSTASHELRTPLAIMQETASLLLEEGMGPLNEKQKMFMTNVKNQADRLLRTVTDLLDLTRIEAGRLQLHKRFVDVREWIGRVVDFFQIHAREKKIFFSAEMPPQGGEIYMDEDKMIQVITNLLGNAVKFTPEGGKVTVSVTDKQDRIEVRVIDTGVGIAPEDIGKIFDRFQQAEHQESVYLQKGTGLGLAITKEIIVMHKGEVGVESQPKVGSTFWFTLPKLTADQVVLEILDNEINRSKEKQEFMTVCLIQQSGAKKSEETSLLDELCLRVGAILRQERDQVLRYQGFMAILMKKTDSSQVKVPLERIEVLLRDCIKNSEQFHSMTFSMAVATYPDHGSQGEELLNFCIKNFHPVTVAL